MLIEGAGKDPTEEDLLRLAKQTDIKKPGAIIEEVQSAVAQFSRLAEQNGLPKRLASRVAKSQGGFA